MKWFRWTIGRLGIVYIGQALLLDGVVTAEFMTIYWNGHEIWESRPFNLKIDYGRYMREPLT